MKYTRENIIKVLKALCSQCLDMAEIFNQNKMEFNRREAMTEALGITEAISLLESEDFFHKMAKSLKME